MTLVIGLTHADELPVAAPSNNQFVPATPVDQMPPLEQSAPVAPAPAPVLTPTTTITTPVLSPIEPVAPGAKPTKGAKVIYKEKSYYDFEDVLINGNLRKPDGSFIFRKSATNFSSALNLKRSFIPELKDSSTNAR